MTAIEQTAYLSAAQCLMEQPSVFDNRTSHYDDLIYAHSKTGLYSHYSAAFLPFHRMYVRVYEQKLQEVCHYEGMQPYWDWTLVCIICSSKVYCALTAFTKC